MFVNDNIQNLWKKMSPQDKHLFNFDVTSVDWKEVMFNGIRGLRVYVMEDPILHVDVEVARYKRCVYL
jgi:fatty acyl-CoA reductase